MGSKEPRTAAAQSESGAFGTELAQLVGSNVVAVEDDNFDADRWPGQAGLQLALEREARSCSETLQDLLKHGASYEAAWRLLADGESRDLFVKLVAYRLLGHRHVRLPANNPEHWRQRSVARAMPGSDSNFSGAFGKLRHYAVEFEGERVSLDGWWMNVAWTFLIRQYYLPRAGIGPRRGDRVLDCGACFGDTALAFAVSVGDEGRVLSFEIDPANAAIARTNIERNPSLSSRIALSERALAHRADLALFRHGSGPGAAVGTAPSEHRLAVATIDAVVESGELDRVDFIKMDIEGAERFTLAGAKQTLQRFRPRLAISLYHRVEDIWEIPLWLDSLGIGYEFYLDHYTIHHEETVLYAIADRA